MWVTRHSQKYFLLQVVTMHLFYIGLLLIPASLAIPAIDTGMGSLLSGKPVDGPEGTIADFAVLIDDNLGKLPESFTICSSTTSKAFAGRLVPFQLLQDNGRPWFTFIILAPQKTTTKHRIILLVSRIQSNVIFDLLMQIRNHHFSYDHF